MAISPCSSQTATGPRTPKRNCGPRALDFSISVLNPAEEGSVDGPSKTARAAARAKTGSHTTLFRSTGPGRPKRNCGPRALDFSISVLHPAEEGSVDGPSTTARDDARG